MTLKQKHSIGTVVLCILSGAVLAGERFGFAQTQAVNQVQNQTQAPVPPPKVRIPGQAQAQEQIPATETAPAPEEGTAAAAAAASSSSSDMATITDAGPGRISLDLKGVDVVELLKILSVKMNVNIVPTKEVTGRVNIFLNNVTFEDALDIILITNGLAAVKDKNIITVMTLEKYSQSYGRPYKETRKVRMFKLKHATPKDVSAALAQLKTEVGKVITDEASGTLILVDIPEALDLMEKAMMTLDQAKETEIFSLKYSKAEDIKNQLANVLTPGSSQVELDARSNKIAISDLPDKMKKIKNVIQAFDDATKEVMIEAQIVQISLNNETQQGINWERVFASTRFPGNIDLKGPFSIAPSPANYLQMTVGTMAAENFTIVMQELNTFTKTNVLSRPRIAAVNNQEASILIGAKEVYFSQTQSQSQVTTTTAEAVNFVDVGVKINVTPTITADNYIIMKIRPEVSSVRETVTSPLGSTVPVVETSQAETTVKVKDNAMVMIAGLMKETISDSRKRIPFLYKIPVIGWFCGNSDKSKQKTEIAIFLTPHIITGDMEKVDAEREEVKAAGLLTKKPKLKME
jgi:MSHA biogenesis protein MshL